jgi:hypothetical protein
MILAKLWGTTISKPQSITWQVWILNEPSRSIQSCYDNAPGFAPDIWECQYKVVYSVQQNNLKMNTKENVYKLMETTITHC